MSTHIKSFIAAIALILFVSAGVSAGTKQKSETVTIQTSAVCETCKKKLEKILLATEGVQEASLNLANKKIKVKYDTAKTNPAKIREVIANSGYNADNVKKSEEAYSKLPHCCQKPENM